MQPRHEAHAAVEVHEEHRQPHRRQLDDAEAELGSSLEHSVHDQVGDRERGRHPQENRRQHRVRGLRVAGVPGLVERPLLVRDVEHGRDVVFDERRPGTVEIRMRERATVHERGRDHRQPDSAGGQGRELAIEPVEVAQGQVGDGVEPAPAVGCNFEDTDHRAALRGHLDREGWRRPVHDRAAVHALGVNQRPSPRCRRSHDQGRSRNE